MLLKNHPFQYFWHRWLHSTNRDYIKFLHSDFFLLLTSRQRCLNFSLASSRAVSISCKGLLDSFWDCWTMESCENWSWTEFGRDLLRPAGNNILPSALPIKTKANHCVQVVHKGPRCSVHTDGQLLRQFIISLLKLETYEIRSSISPKISNVKKIVISSISVLFWGWATI